MPTTPKILAFAGSLRAGSFNKKLVRIAAAGARNAGAEVTEIDLRDYQLPVYDGDLEAADGLPENAHRLKELFLGHDGLLIASPEYNSSISAVLKNTIDWVSRPAPNEGPLAGFMNKVAGLMATSPGALGGLRGLADLRSILGNIHVTVIPAQRAVPFATKAFDDDGALTDEKMQQAIEQIGSAVANVTARLTA